MSENNVPCIQLIGDKEDFARQAEAEVLPYEGARRLNLGPVTTYFDGKGGIKHILALTPERVRILEDAIHEYYLHEKDQDGPDLLEETEVLADSMTGAVVRSISLVRDPLPHCGFNEPDLSTRVLPESADDLEHNRRRIEVFSSEIVTVTNEMLRDLDVPPDVRAWLADDYRNYRRREALRSAGGFGVPWDISRNEPEDV